MSFTELPLLEQLVLVLAAISLFLSFSLLAQPRLVTGIHLFAWQGGTLAAATSFMATGYPDLYLSAMLTLGLKAFLIPWMLHRLVRRLNLERHTEALTHGGFVLILGAALVIFSYWISVPVERLAAGSTRNILAFSLAAVLLGMLIMVSRRQAVMQVIGFMSMENGLFLAAVSATRGMPLVVELGVAFDVLVAAILFGVFFLHISESIESLDVDRLNRLAAEEGEEP
ncbi:MAG: formate hydrogenlyase [Gammaproteobacteria bacterium]|nr:MAG: formate hydrogenlyase [Gammaproteobacteria bacterium]